MTSQGVSYGAPVAPPQYDMNTGGGSGDSAPKKYVMIDGVMQLNPEYIAYKEGQGQKASTALNPEQALPVVSSMLDAMEYQQAAMAEGGSAPPLAEATNQTIMIMQEEDICERVGLESDELVDSLGRIFSKHETPLGLMNKLMVLQTFDRLEFIVDDSGSMAATSDTVDETGRQQTRWEEARARLKELVEVMAYVPTPVLEISFLNRGNTLTLQQNGQSQRPEEFINSAYAQIDSAFANSPSGLTPIRERLQQSFHRGSGQRIARYLFCDGSPSGFGAREAVTEMIRTRQNPADNPMTLLSCTNQDNEVEWMKEAEEIAPYTAEYDDLADEQREVARDQGEALPYTKGFHLIGQLVGAMNPDDLDAMDESIPFTKYTLDNLYGIQTNEQDYRRYFEGFLKAQRTRTIESQLDKFKRDYPWQSLVSKFLAEKMSKNIFEVQEFKRKLEEASK